jgi:ABC-type Fe3+-hydroxamate transport system substrate-binding protein
VRRAVLVRTSVFFLAAARLAAAAEPPRRVASLNLTADEILVEILPPERLVAVTALADERGTSNVVGRVPRTAVRFPKADLERLVSLRADLVVVSEYTDADFLKQVERSGLRYHRMEGLQSLDGYRAAILELGRVVGAAEGARRLVARYDSVLADLAKRLQGASRPRMLYWSDPYTAGADTAFDALIECGGARNAGRDLGLKGIAAIGAERAFLSDPDVLLLPREPRAGPTVPEDSLLRRTRAFREGHVVEMPNELLVALSQYAADACWHLAAGLHPDRVPQKRP